MKNTLTSALTGLAFAGITLAGLPAAADKLGPADKKEIEQVIRDYLLKNPELIIEVMDKLRERERVAQEKAAAQVLAANETTIYRNAMSPVSGNKDGDVTLVEFFDYQCGYCKRVVGSMVDLIGEDKKLRVVWKELPILGPDSRYAAVAAMAAERQGKYLDFHVALMKNRGGLSPEVVMRIADKTGLDVAKLQKDMGDPKIAAYLDKTIELAQALGIRGTPGFIIGDKIIPGAVGLDELKKLIAEARKPKS
jgi:protein-disulfide isomerase